MTTAFIPVLKYQDGTVEVFTSKWKGIVFESLEKAKQAIPDNAWLCDSSDVAIMRALDVKLMLPDNERLNGATASYLKV